MGVFEGIEKAKSIGSGDYIRPGKYLFEITGCKSIKSRKPGGSPSFIVETRVLKSTKTDPEIQPNEVDSNPAWVVKFGGEYPEMPLANAKAFMTVAYNFLAAANGIDPIVEEDVTEKMADEAVDENQMFAGIILEANAFHKMTQKNKPFTIVNWSLPANIEELIEAA